MWTKPSVVLLLVTLVCLPCLLAVSQDAPSLGDTARRTRHQGKDQPAAPKAVKVLTDEDAPQPTQESAPSTANDQGRPATSTNAKPAPGNPKQTAEEWKEQIQAQKNGISAMQSQIDKLNASIHFVAASCTGCREWNELQLKKQQEVERARGQLEEQKKRRTDMQEAARQQGYGSPVYGP